VAGIAGRKGSTTSVANRACICGRRTNPAASTHHLSRSFSRRRWRCIIESDATSEGWQRFADVANWTIWAVFAIELTAVLIVAQRKKAALRAHWLDVAIVVLTVPLLGRSLGYDSRASFALLVSEPFRAARCKPNVD
jgi:hypothetical protein